MNSITRLIIIAMVAALGALLPQRASAQWILLEADADSLARQGLDVMYNLEYEAADSIFNKIVQRHPNEPVGYFLLALNDWWRIVPNIAVQSKVDRYSKSFHERIDKAIEVSDDRLDSLSSDMTALFFKSAAMGYKARLKVSNNFSTGSVLDLVSAGMDGMEAYKLLLECQRMAPSNSDILLGSGLITYLSDAIPSRFPTAGAALNFMPPGDRQLGMNMLRISARRATYVGIEAKYALLELLCNFEAGLSTDRGAVWKEAIEIARELHERYPGNSNFNKYLAKAYYSAGITIHGGYFVQADSAYMDILRRVKRREPGYELTFARQALFFLGDARLQQGRFEDAIRLFQEVEQQSSRLDDKDSERWIVKSALLMGNAYDMLKRRSEAIRQYRKVLDLDDFDRAHEKATKHLATAFPG